MTGAAADTATAAMLPPTAWAAGSLAADVGVGLPVAGGGAAEVGLACLTASLLVAGADPAPPAPLLPPSISAQVAEMKIGLIRWKRRA